MGSIALFRIHKLLFNSITFFIFFSIVLILYFLLPHRWQNRMLLVASYFFYGWWDWRFLSLIFVSTATDYLCGIQIHQKPNKAEKKKYLLISIITNLSLLGFFKYWNFFTDSFVVLLSQIGVQPSFPTLNIVLPVGISFYTFQTLTYSIDIYRGELEPTYEIIDFALFVAFFPQLVAGPIERAKRLLPQIKNSREFKKEQFLRGLHLIFWGLFKKVFLADNLGLIVDQVYGNPQSTGIEYIIGSWAFAFQIYGDFSGYSDIARGSSKCMGFELMHNFRQPYFAVNPSDIWLRWHISFSSWLRDYLYIPLGGNRKGVWKTYRNLLLTMSLGGLWHGAGWNFILWGVYHGALLCLQRLYQSSKIKATTAIPSLGAHLLKAFIVFQLFCIGLVIFRAQGLRHMKTILISLMNSLYWTEMCTTMMSDILFYSFLPMLVMGYKHLVEIRPSWFDNHSFYNYSRFSRQPLYIKSYIYGTLTYMMCLYGAEAETFFYFQF